MAVRQYIGFTPYDHQRAVIDELRDAKGTGKVVVCKSSRQKGKSFMIVGLLLYYAINYSNTKNYCLSPSFKQAKNIYQTIIDAIIKSGIVKTKNKTDLVIKLINGSTINFKSAEQGDALRGESADFLCIDECAYIPDDVFHIVLPWVDAKKAPCLFVSTPFTRNGWFHQYFQYGLEKSHNTVSIDWSDPKFKESIEKILSQERLEEYRKMLPHRVFVTEYLGEWLDEDGVVFTNVRKCVENNVIKPTDKLSVGLDWSNQGENDDTVISIFNQQGKQVYCRHFNNLTPFKQIDLIFGELEPILNQVSVITSETNSLGKPYTDMLKARSQVISDKMVEFTTTNQSKNALVTNFQVAMENNEITLLDDPAIINQFSYFSCEFNPKTRNVTYGAPQGLHDDIVLATLFAYDGIKEINKRGTYNISVI